MAEYPKRARAVIIGGGVVGASIAYHLTLRGVRNVLLLERKQLTSGTTWHAAGLVGQLRATQNLTRLAQYSAKLYAGLEAETGQATGLKQVGSLSLATTPARLEELLRSASMARSFGLEVEPITAAQARDMWPLLQADDVVGGVHLPGDGQINPVDVTLALAKGARLRGARIIENAEVADIVLDRGRAIGVRTAQGDIEAETVVLAAGLWSRELAARAGVNVPLHAAEHFYIVTEPIPGLSRQLPVMRDPDNCAYYKEEAGKLLIGWFEPKAKPWEPSPDAPPFQTLPPDLDHIEPMMEAAIRRVPVLAQVGVQLFFNGPESFTPDDRYLLGETPEARGLYVATGFNSIGIQSAGGAGKVLADWIVDGFPPMDLWDVDIRRMAPFQRNRAYLRERTTEGLGLLYAMHWPFRQPESARGVRRSVLHDRLKAAGACFGETAGWERPNWYAPPGVAAEYQYSYGRQNWFAHSAQEHRAVRENVGLFDQSSFGKFVVEGPDAEAALDRICANGIAVPVGRVVYTQWLNDRGGIEADVTVTRESETRFLVVTSAACQTRDLAWLKRNLGEARAVAVDVTSGYAVLGLMGPRSRDLLSQLTDADLCNAAFPFGTSQEIDLGFARARASRITYVGELGWELYLPTEFAQAVYDAVVEAGAPFGLKLAGYHAMNSLRIEKAYRHWGHDVTEEDTPDEAGLAFAVKLNKSSDFIGREALERRRRSPLARRLAQFTLDDENPLLYHNEPVYQDGRLVGRIASGMFGHTIRRAIGLGYVAADVAIDGPFEIEIAGRRWPARAHLRPVYDPGGARVRM
jgi:4-methylaminobutanoate oxidase (formaldehyde-forming)